MLFTGERALGPTFPIETIGWIDFETLSRTDLKKAGAYRYADEAVAIICSYAIGDGPVSVFTARKPGTGIDFTDFPLELLRHHAKVMNGRGVWAAWNAAFDKAIWNYSIPGTPQLEPQMIIDVMAQATAAGLPPDLDMAAKMSGASHKKIAEGKDLIKVFCDPGSKFYSTPQAEPEQWERFKAYASADIAAMRSVFKLTRQLSLAEWREYWAMERINERGVAIDIPMVTSAARLAAEDKLRTAAEIYQLTAGEIRGVDQVKAITEWLLRRLPTSGVTILTKVEEETDDDGETTRPAKYSLTRRRIERLLAMCADMRERGVQMPDLDTVERVLQLRYYGGSKTPAKFGRMLASHVGGMLHGQYVFSGAPQTGRASSKGVQVHNLARDVLPFEADAIDAVLAGIDYDGLARLGNSDPVSRKLSLLIRPAFVPRETGNVFVWSDWSQIEARVLPWLAGEDSRGALARLQIFREVDRDPSVPDLYTRTAAAISHIPITEVTKPIRQRGKVAELALGFGGGVGALHAMGAGYGLFLTDAEAKTIVTRWREANPWCVYFWGSDGAAGSSGLWGAAHRAMREPGKEHRAGRIYFVYQPGYLGGSLLCILPSSRILTYRAIRYETTDDTDDDGNVIGSSSKLRYARAYGRSTLWHGTICENVVQACAADILRGTLRRIKMKGDIVVRLHTHDEIVLECPEVAAELVSKLLRVEMQRGFDWTEGLPLMSEETIGLYYTKLEGGHAL